MDLSRWVNRMKVLNSNCYGRCEQHAVYDAYANAHRNPWDMFGLSAETFTEVGQDVMLRHLNLMEGFKLRQNYLELQRMPPPTKPNRGQIYV